MFESANTTINTNKSIEQKTVAINKVKIKKYTKATSHNALSKVNLWASGSWKNETSSGMGFSKPNQSKNKCNYIRIIKLKF